MIIRNHHCLLFFCKDLFGAICCALGSTERTTLPQVMIKGFNFRKEKTPTSLARRGLTRDYLPYNSSVWELKQCMYLISGVCSKAYCISWYRFRHPPSKGLELLTKRWTSQKYENNFKHSKHNYFKTDTCNALMK